MHGCCCLVATLRRESHDGRLSAACTRALLDRSSHHCSSMLRAPSPHTCLPTHSCPPPPPPPHPAAAACAQFASTFECDTAGGFAWITLDASLATLTPGGASGEASLV